MEVEIRKGRTVPTSLGARLLLHQVEAVPIAAEVLDLSGGQLESRAELAVLEEDVRIAQAGGVQVLPLPLLSEDALDALDQPDLLEDADLAVACRDRDAIPLADFLGADLPLVCGEKDLRAVFIRQELRSFEGRQQLRRVLEAAVLRVCVVLHGIHPLILSRSRKVQTI